MALFPQVRSAWDAAALLALQGIGTACFWPGQSTLLARLADPETRHHAYALQRISMNLGIGLGGVVGGLIATTADPHSFTVLYLLDAATFLAFVVVLGFVREPRPGPTPHGEAKPGYREVLRDRPFLALLGLNVVFVAAGYETVLLTPVYAKNQAGVSERWIGMIWFANTLFIVLAQMPISKWLEGRRRMVALAAMNVCFAAAALVILVGGTLFEAGAAALGDGRRDADLRGRRVPPGADAGRARRRHGAVTPQRALLRALEHVVDHRRDSRPGDRRAAARLEAERRLAARSLRLPARGSGLPRAGAAPASRAAPHAARRTELRACRCGGCSGRLQRVECAAW